MKQITNIIPTSTARRIAEKLVGKEGIKVIFPEENKDFPDGEIDPSVNGIKEIKGEIVALHSGAPRPNRGLRELKMLLKIISRNSNCPVKVVLLYPPYARSDNILEIGKTNAAEDLIEELISCCGVKKIYTIDAHFSCKGWAKNLIEKGFLINVSVVDLLIRIAKEKYPDIIVLAADKGAERRIGDENIKGIEKERISPYVVKIKKIPEKVSGKDVLIIDDMISTGGTAIEDSKQLIEVGAKKVVVAVTHVIIPSGIKKVAGKCELCLATNTINHGDIFSDEEKVNIIDISDLIAETIRK